MAAGDHQSGSRVLHLVIGIPLILMMVHVCLDVFARYIYRPLPGTLEIVSAHYMVIAVFMPLALVEWWRKSVSVDVVYLLFPRRMKLVVISLVLACVTIVYFALAWRTWGDAMGAFRRGDFLFGGTFEVSTWQSRFALPIGFGSAGLVTLWQLFGVLSGRDRESWLEEQALDDTELE